MEATRVRFGLEDEVRSAQEESPIPVNETYQTLSTEQHKNNVKTDPREQNNCTNWLWYAGLQRRMSPSPGSPRLWRRMQLYLPVFVCIRIKGSCQTTARSPSILGRPSLCTAPSVVAQAVRRM